LLQAQFKKITEAAFVVNGPEAARSQLDTILLFLQIAIVVNFYIIHGITKFFNTI